MNDPLLAPLVDAADEISRERELERIVITIAQPLIRRIVAGSRISLLRDEDIDDIIATVDVRLVGRLRRAALFEDDAIASLLDFVATLAYHTIYDFLRKRFPEWTRLKNRMRYILTHDPRLAMWATPAGVVAGPSDWRDRAPQSARLRREDATAAMQAASAPAGALLAIFGRTGHPMLLDDLVALVAELWGVADRTPGEGLEPAIDTAPAPDTRLESRELLETLWREIRELRPAQRAALLLHIRDADGFSALALLVLLGIATIDEVAAALEISAADLAALWRDLPLDDLAIASILGVTRQQVINLRKAARARLGRRMSRGGNDS